jgi:hypothetical protein
VTLSTLAAELAAGRAGGAGVLREVYDLYVTCNRGQEELEPVTPPAFDAFVAGEVEGPRAVPKAWFLARAGGRLVGLSTLERLPGAPDAPGLPIDFPVLRVAGSRPTNLPAERNAFVSRVRELAAIADLLR